jgi:hypothetical protein
VGEGGDGELPPRTPPPRSNPPSCNRRSVAIVDSFLCVGQERTRSETYFLSGFLLALEIFLIWWGEGRTNQPSHHL